MSWEIGVRLWRGKDTMLPSFPWMTELIWLMLYFSCSRSSLIRATSVFHMDKRRNMMMVWEQKASLPHDNLPFGSMFNCFSESSQYPGMSHVWLYSTKLLLLLGNVWVHVRVSQNDVLHKAKLYRAWEHGVYKGVQHDMWGWDGVYCIYTVLWCILYKVEHCATWHMWCWDGGNWKQRFGCFSHARMTSPYLDNVSHIHQATSRTPGVSELLHTLLFSKFSDVEGLK